MSQAIIFQPLFTLILITALVWVVLFVRRIRFLSTHKLAPEVVGNSTSFEAALPAAAVAAGNNFKNLFEMPVLFYALCLVAFQLNVVDDMLVSCAWAFVGLRALHSLVHCTYNRVNHRFLAYLASCFVLWFMAARVALAIF